MTIIYQYEKFGRKCDFNDFLSKHDPVSIEKIDYTVETSEYGVGTTLIHVIHKVWIEDKPNSEVSDY